jgi:DNA-binding transcriptional regulator/RsmH inhibitor MraZ
MTENTLTPGNAELATLKMRQEALKQLRLPHSGDRPNLEHLLTGMKEVTVDDKGRLNIPGQFWDKMGGDAPVHIFLPPTKQGLWVFSATEFKALYDSALEETHRPLNKAEPIERVTLMLNYSESVTPDGLGRITIPADYLRAVGFKKRDRVVVVGSGNFLEVLRPTLPASKPNQIG